MTKLRISQFKKSLSASAVTAAAAALFFVLVAASVFIAISPHESKLGEGDIALRDIYAPFDFVYQWGIDEEKTGLARGKAAESVPPVYNIDGKAYQAAVDRLNTFFSGIAAIQATDDKEAREKKTAELGAVIDLHKNGLNALVETPYNADINRDAQNLARIVLARGVMAAEAKKELLEKNVKNIVIIDPDQKTEKETKAVDIPTVDEAKKKAAEYAEGYFLDNRNLRQAALGLVSAMLAPNLVFDKAKTDARINREVEAVPAVHNMVEVKKNELVVEKGRRVTKRHQAGLAQIDRIRGTARKGSYFAGILLLMLISLGVSSVYLHYMEKKALSDPRNIAIGATLSYMIILIAIIILQSPQPSYLIPMASVGMLLVMLVNFNTAFIATLFLSIFISALAGGKLDTFAVFIFGSMMGIYAVRGARKRGRILFSGFLVGAVNVVVICYVGFLNNLPARVFLTESGWGMANGFLSSFIVLALLPVFEFVFKIPTNITLLELSDLNNPLLKELTMKAPGTYHHSLLVGNLAEAACDAIGANSLLARVGAYYHDIGKIEKAEYFSENEMGASSKHDKLSPSMSALIITSHPKDGLELARKYKLNKAVTDFITQHHGTSLIYYFYQRALEKVKDEEALKEEEFRYPGPKPQTKETAIVLLADSVEASSRTLSDPTPARIKGLVQKIINNRFIDNQLDECDLTLKDLNKISEAFVRVLTGVFHTRLEYPEMKKGGNKNKR